MKILLHVITLVVTLVLAVSGILAWRFGLELIENQTFYYDGVVQGQITRAKPKIEGTDLTPGLRYVFEVGGHVVKGKNYRRNLITKKELSKAREIAARLEPETKVKVYYRIGAGGEVQSVLDPHPDPMAHLLYVGGVPLSFFVVTLYLVVVVLRLRRKPGT
ncbi:MAG: hypothetical protein VCA36_12040 [Opitutales bacterium]